MTAVEQLIYDMRNIDMSIFNDEHCKKYLDMEKEQIMDSYCDGRMHLIDKHVIPMEQYYNETYGSKGSDECYFEPTTNTSSATICKHCGREKFLHKG